MLLRNAQIRNLQHFVISVRLCFKTHTQLTLEAARPGFYVMKLELVILQRARCQVNML